MNTTTPVGTLVQSFNASSREQILMSGEALLKGDTGAFDRMVEKVSEHPIVKQIGNRINTASSNLSEFFDYVENASPALKAIFGAVIAGVGGAAIAEAVGLAAAIGISIISVKVIAVVLILIGIGIALPAIWELALKKFDKMWPDLGI